MIDAISSGSSNDGVPPPKKIVSALQAVAGAGRDLRRERGDVARLQRLVVQAAVEIAVIADRRAERDVDVEAEVGSGIGRSGDGCGSGLGPVLSTPPA